VNTAPTLECSPRIGRGFRLQWEPVQDAWVLLYPEGMVKLNQSGGEILKRCDGTRSVAQIVAELEQAFGMQGLEKDVVGFMEIAGKQRWLEWEAA
jgi:pyrroloquinoline quinone biosynthesis protein D